MKRSPLSDLRNLTVAELSGGFQGDDSRSCDGGGHGTENPGESVGYGKYGRNSEPRKDRLSGKRRK